jgi:hypothetical protein
VSCKFHTHTPYYSLERTSETIEQEVTWAPETVRLGGNKMSCLPGNRTPGRPARSLISIVVYVKGIKFQLSILKLFIPAVLQ